MCRCRVTEASGADLMHVCELQSSRGVGGGPHVRANMGGELFSKLVWRQLLETILSCFILIKLKSLNFVAFTLKSWYGIALPSFKLVWRVPCLPYHILDPCRCRVCGVAEAIRRRA